MSEFVVGRRYRAKYAKNDREGLIEVTGRDEDYIYYRMVVTGFERKNRYHKLYGCELLRHDFLMDSNDEVVE